MSRFVQTREPGTGPLVQLRSAVADSVARLLTALSSTRGRIVAASTLAVLFAIAVVAWFVLREPIERAALSRMLGSATGYVVSLDGVRHENGLLVLVGLHAHARGGALMLDVDRIDIDKRGAHMSLVVEAPRFAVLPDRWRGVERENIRLGFGKLHLDGSLVDARVSHGSVAVAAGAVPALAAYFSDLEGVVHLNKGRLTYHLTAALADGDQRYPVAGVADIVDSGEVTGRWSAAALPLVPLATAIPPSAPIQVRGGWLRDVAATYGAQPFRVEATVEDGDLELIDVGRHELRDVRGGLALGEHSLGSTGVHATLDGLPFDFVGEVHDIQSRFRWVVDGSPDLRALGRLMFSIAAEPGLQSVHCETTAPGALLAQYSLLTDHGPLAVTALLANPHEPTLRFDTAIAEDRIVSQGERTSSMGVRTHAVGGVNGDYFDIGRTYQPQGLLIRSGTLLRGPTDRYALIVRRNGTVAFDEFHLKGIVRTPRAKFSVTQLNNWPAGHVTIITPDFGKVLPPAAGVTFVALAPIEAKPPGHYRVTEVAPVNTSVPVTFGLAFGPLVKGVLPRLGDDVQLEYALDPAVDAVAGIGGGPRLLKDGAWFEDRHAPAPDERDVRWPVVGLARLTDDWLLLVAVDGRHLERSVGMTRPEFAELLQRFGATDAMALDSGGSVTLVSRAPGDENVSVRNQPSDNSAERWVSDALFLYSSAGAPEIVVPRAATTPLPEARPTP